VPQATGVKTSSVEDAPLQLEMTGLPSEHSGNGG
jgi:hypothetical protein